MVIIKYKRFLNYFNTFIGVIIDCLNKMNINYFDKHLRKIFTNVNIINYLSNYKMNMTIKVIEINIYECLFFFTIKDMKFIANSE